MVPVALVDYNMGNLGSVSKALECAGADVRVISRPDELEHFQVCVLPGVGNFGDGMENLRSSGFDRAVPRFVDGGGRFLGICLGMQMLLQGSEEAPGVAGLGVFPGTVVRFPDDGGQKVPHMGWNGITFQPGCPVAAGIPDNSYFYFVHSYYVPPAPEYTLAACEYIRPFAAVIGRGRYIAAQFHPEKSQRAGLRLLGNFLALAEGGK
ncbi:MAG: imidazole glycerol phosphate synthase subunit HisH [Victivallaceae bacterium]|nr:imidazole glycerol phosphate synthase subunit HisH [Victivallaceae bacterium]